MPSEINIDQFNRIITDKKANQLRVKRVMKGKHQGWTKLKLRTNSQLCTLVVKDPNQAKILVKNCAKSVNVVKVKKNGKY